VAPTSRRQNSSLERKRKNAEIREDGIDGRGGDHTGRGGSTHGQTGERLSPEAPYCGQKEPFR